MANESYQARSCLFCHEQTFSLPSEIEIKEDEEAGDDNFVSNTQSWKVPSRVKEQLKPIFIVRKLLDIPEEKCAEYLQHNDNDSENPSSWFAVCQSCNSTVEESYKIYRKIKRLECNLESLKVKLKHSILRVRINEGSNGSRRTRRGIELGNVRDFIHVDIHKFVTEENFHIFPDQALPVAAQEIAKRVNRKRQNRRKVNEITAACDFPDSDWHVDSPLDDFHDASEFDTEWQPISNQESDHLPSNAKEENGDEYDSDYSPSLMIRKRKSRCKTKTRTKRIRKRKFNYKFIKAIPWYCDHCHMIYKSKVVLLRHIQIFHNNIVNLPCSFCDTVFPTKQLLELHHKEQHPSSSETGDDDVSSRKTKEEPQMCEHCPKSFSSKLKLDFHIATLHQDMLLTCKICGHKSEKYGQFVDHSRSKHNDLGKKDQQYMCHHCPKTFSSSCYLHGHMKAIHFDLLGINPLICKECNVTFPAYSALVEHENHVHKKIKGRCCEYCGKAFSRGCDLKRHILLHTATREEQYKKGPFFCQFCQAKFNVRQALYYHLKKHHTDKYAHKCDYCGTGYVTQNTLLQHLRKCKAKKQAPTPPTQTPPSSAATIDVSVNSVKQEANNA